MITTTGLSGSTTVGNVRTTGTPFVNAERLYVTGVYNTNLIGSFTCGTVKAETDYEGIRVRGIGVSKDLTGTATCGDVSGTDDIVAGIAVFQDLTGTATCGDVSGTNTVVGVYVQDLTGTATCGNVSGSYAANGVYVEQNLSGIVTCGNVSGINFVYGIAVQQNLSGKATCGDVSGTNTVTGVQVVLDLSGTATCGNVSGTNFMTGVEVGQDLSGIVTCGNVSGTTIVYGVYVIQDLTGTATCGNVSGTDTVYGVVTIDLSGTATCGNVSGTNEVRGLYVEQNLTGTATCGDVSGDATDVNNPEGLKVYGLFLSNVSGKVTCGDVTGTNIEDVTGIFISSNINETSNVSCGNVTGDNNFVTGIQNSGTIAGTVTCGNVKNIGVSNTGGGVPGADVQGAYNCQAIGLIFYTVYPEAKITIGDVEAINGFAYGATSSSDNSLAILAGTTIIGDVSCGLNNLIDGVNHVPCLGCGDRSNNIQNIIMSDSFVSYTGINENSPLGKGLEFEVSINDNSYDLSIEELDNTSGYTTGEKIIINGEFFGGDENNDVELTITANDDGAITTLEFVDSNPPTNPRVTTTGTITTTGLSGSITVGNVTTTLPISPVDTPNYIIGFNMKTLNGSAICRDVTDDSGLTGYGIRVLNLNGSATCGNISLKPIKDDFTGLRAITGIIVTHLNGTAICGNISGSQDDSTGSCKGIDVTNLNGSVNIGDITASTTNHSSVFGIILSKILTGSVICGNIIGGNTTSDTSNIGITFEGENCVINGSVNIKSAKYGIIEINEDEDINTGTITTGTGKVIIGSQDGGNQGNIDSDDYLSVYVYGNTVILP